MADHPLDHEEVTATVTLVHTPTGASVAVSLHASCDAPPSVSKIIADAGEQAKDMLLNQLESF